MKKWLAALMLVLLLLMAACSGSSNSGAEGDSPNSPGEEKEATPSPAPPLPPDPVELSIYMRLNTNKDYTQEVIVGPIQQKYPHVTLELVYPSETVTPETLNLANNFPDIVWAALPWIGEFTELKLLENMNDLVRMNSYNLNQHHASAIDLIRQWGQNGELYAIPLWMNFSALYYNKEIFEDFGVDYPKDGLFWDELNDLARAVTRTSNDRSIKGLDMSSAWEIASQLSLPYYNQQTGRAVLDTSGFDAPLRFIQQILSIPGNDRDPAGANRGANLFYRGELAMMVGWNILHNIEPRYVDGTLFDWDLATMPSFREAPGKGFQIDAHTMSVSSTSKHKELAFQIVSEITGKGDIQRTIAAKGRVSAVVDAELQSIFATELESTKGRNIAGIFKSDPAPIPQITIFDTAIRNHLGRAFDNIIYSGMDVNTALREANEAANLEVESIKSR